MVKKPPAKARFMGSSPGLGRCPGEENGNLLQYSCLENSVDRGAWWLQSMGLQRVRQDLQLNNNGNNEIGNTTT